MNDCCRRVDGGIYKGAPLQIWASARRKGRTSPGEVIIMCYGWGLLVELLQPLPRNALLFFGRGPHIRKVKIMTLTERERDLNVNPEKLTHPSSAQSDCVVPAPLLVPGAGIRTTIMRPSEHQDYNNRTSIYINTALIMRVLGDNDCNMQYIVCR